MKLQKITRHLALAAALMMMAAPVPGVENVPLFPPNNYVSLGSPAVLQMQPGSPLTVEGWVKFKTLTPTAIQYSKSNGRNAPYTCMFGVTGGGTRMAAYTGARGFPADTWVEVILPTGLAEGTWHHLAYACDGGQIFFFVDGACVGRRHFSFADAPGHTIRLGGHADGHDIQGSISDVRVWNHARSPQQISLHKDRRLIGDEDGLLGYWRLDKGAGRVVPDAKGVNDGALTDGVTWVKDESLVLSPAVPTQSAKPAVVPASDSKPSVPADTVKAIALASRPSAPATNFWTGRRENGLWHDAANWSAGIPAAGQNVAILTTGGVVRLTKPTASLYSLMLGTNQTLMVEGWDSALTATRLVIAGTVTHAENVVTSENWVTWIPAHRVLIRGADMVVTVAGRINADARGYRGGHPGDGQGPGGGQSLAGSPVGGGGGSYGGWGGNDHFADCGPVYGEAGDPWQPGSGGAGWDGGAGGGAVRIVLDGRLTVDGEIRAGGGDGGAERNGGGSGGGILLECRTFGGAGRVSANGGSGVGYGGCGGGGRIAMHFDGAEQKALGLATLPLVETLGGKNGAWIHATDKAEHAMGSIHVDDTAFFGAVWPPWAGWFHFAGDRIEVRGDLTLAHAVSLAAGMRLDVGGNLTLTNGGILRLIAAATPDPATVPGAGLNVAGALRILQGGVIHPGSHPTNGASVRIKAGRLTVEGGGTIDASGRGFRGGSVRPADDPALGRGHGYGPGGATAKNEGGTYYGGGGSHGGLGGDGYANSWRGERYGTTDSPWLPGSGGAGHAASHGGGLVWVEVAGHARINGEVRADGGSGTGFVNYGGGSGGSVRLACRTLDGSGRITANAGQGSGNGGTGGGGRIALLYDPAAQAAVPPPGIVCEMLPGTGGYTMRSSSPDEDRLGTLWLPDIQLLGTNWASWTGWLHLPTNHLLVAGNLSVTNGWAGLAGLDSVRVGGNLMLGSAGVLCIDPQPTTALWLPGARLEVEGALMVNTGGTLLVRSSMTNGAPLKVTAAEVTVGASGLVSGDARGYFGQQHPWPAFGPGGGIQGSEVTHGTGGGHGGRGGHGYNGVPGGRSYGLPFAPLSPGSGGGGRYWGGHGGAAIWISTPGVLRIDGEIRSNGGVARSSFNGAGAGGGILLDAGRIVGATGGMIRADGGAGNIHGGAGGGGRIACWQGMPPDVAAGLIRGVAGGMVPGAPPASYKGKVSASGATGFISYEGNDPNIRKQSGDGTVVWLSFEE